jgi:lambda family phage portal protein
MSRFRRALGVLFGRSAIEAAGVGRRWTGFRPVAAPKEQMAASRPLIMNRARALVLNNALAASGVEAWVSGLIGSGILGKSANSSEGVRKRIDRAWADWTKACDADGRLDFAGLQALVARRVVVDGEAIILLLVRDGRLRIRVLSSEQLSDFSQIALPSGGYISNGIEFNAAGERVAYWLYPTAPGAIPTGQPVRVPASDCLHIYRHDHPGQLRGLSWFAPILLALNEHAKLTDAVTMQQQVAAMLTGFIRTNEGDASAIFTGERKGAEIVPSLEPATMVALEAGQDVTFTTPPRSTGAEHILKVNARQIAVGLGIPYEALSGDLEAVNYSSIRAGLVEFRRKCEALQETLFAVQLLAPIFARFVTVEALGGRLYAPGSLSLYTGSTWFAPKQAWVDPLKDSQAESLAISSGLMSRTEALAQRGWDAEEVDAQIAADRAREQRLGLSFQPVAQAPAKADEVAQ